MIKVLIVDDEPLAIEVLETYVDQYDDLQLVGKCNNALDADAFLRKEKVDLLLLDVQMPQVSGIEFLKSLKNPPLVILTTAFSQYALEGYELDVVDYLLKPTPADRFLKAINKVRERLEVNPNTESASIDIQKDFIFVKADKKIVRVNFEDVLYIEGLKDYVIIRCNNERIITLQTMKSLEEKLPSTVFQRIHRSYILNLSHMKAIMGNMVEIEEKGEKKHLPIGKNYREALFAKIENKRL